MNRTILLKILVLLTLTSGLIAVFVALFRFHLEVRRLLAFKSNTNWTIEEMLSTTFNPHHGENETVSDMILNISSMTSVNPFDLDDDGETTTEFLNPESEENGTEFITTTLVPELYTETEKIPTTTLGGPITRESRASKSQPEFDKNDLSERRLDERPGSLKPKSRRLIPTRAISSANLAVDELTLMTKDNVIKLGGFPQITGRTTLITEVDMKSEMKSSLPLTALQAKRSQTKSQAQHGEEVVTHKENNPRTNETSESITSEQILAKPIVPKQNPRRLERLEPANRIRGRKRKVQQSIEETPFTLKVLNTTAVPIPTGISELSATISYDKPLRNSTSEHRRVEIPNSSQPEVESESETTEYDITELYPIEESNSQEQELPPGTIGSHIKNLEMSQSSSDIYSSEEDASTEPGIEHDSKTDIDGDPYVPKVEKSQVVINSTVDQTAADEKGIEPIEQPGSIDQGLSLPILPPKPKDAQSPELKLELENPIISVSADEFSKPDATLLTNAEELAKRTSPPSLGSSDLVTTVPASPQLSATNDQVKSDSSLQSIQPVPNAPPILSYYAYGSFESGLSSGSVHGNLLDPRLSVPQEQIVYLFPNLQFQQHLPTAQPLSIQTQGVPHSQFVGSTAFVPNELSTPPVLPLLPKSVYHYQDKNNFYWGVENFDGTTSEQRGSIKLTTENVNGRFVTQFLEGLYSYHGMDGKIYATSYTSDSSAYRPMNV